MSAADRHAPHACEPTPTQQMKDDALDKVVGGVRDGHRIRACFVARAAEKRVTEGASACLE